jgi:single-stranded-DNA-specific exonuclease
VRKIEDHPQLLDQKTIVLADRSWHEGVLGIVATKLAAQYYRPVILIAMDNEIGKGSGRSIPGVDLFSALNRCAPVLDKFGGHCMAAGLTIKAENINQLRAGLEAAATELTQTYDYQPRLKIDSEIQFNEISPRLLDELENLAPFGADNPAPLFMARDVRVKTAAVVGRQHRRMALYQCTPEPLLNAMQFNIRPDRQKTVFFNRLAFRLQWNRFNETKQIQLVVEAY